MKKTVFEARFDEISTRLTATANAYARYKLEADDILQIMYETVLERSADDDSLARIATLCKWRAADFVKASLVYTAYVDTEMTGWDEENGETVSNFDILPDLSEENQNPEDLYVRSEGLAVLIQTIEKLAPRDKQIIAMLYAGKTQSEIGRDLGVTRKAIYGKLRVKGMGKKLQAILPKMIEYNLV